MVVLLYSCNSRDDIRGVSKFEYKSSTSFDHIKHIRAYSDIGASDEIEESPKYLVDYVIENLLQKKRDSIFITDRKLLRKFDNKVCWNDYVLISDTLLNGKKLRIEIKSREFDLYGKKMVRDTGTNFLIEIDGKWPFGATYGDQPEREIETLTIEINGSEINSSVTSYKNLYEPNFCNFGMHTRITEAYEDGEFIYIYIFGGGAAGSYFAKLIFHKTDGYQTSIVADYVPLSQYGSFGEHFIGF